jgi:hypothetical protein
MIEPEAELVALPRSVERGSPFGGESWVKRTAAVLGRESSLNPPRRPAERARAESEAEGLFGPERPWMHPSLEVLSMRRRLLPFGLFAGLALVLVMVSWAISLSERHEIRAGMPMTEVYEKLGDPSVITTNNTSGTAVWLDPPISVSFNLDDGLVTDVARREPFVDRVGERSQEDSQGPSGARVAEAEAAPIPADADLQSDEQIQKLAKLDIDKATLVHGGIIDLDVVPNGESCPRAQVFKALRIEDGRIRDFRQFGIGNVIFLTWQISPSYDICCMTATNDSDNNGLKITDPKRKVYGIRLLRRSQQRESEDGAKTLR